MADQDDPTGGDQSTGARPEDPRPFSDMSAGEFDQTSFGPKQDVKPLPDWLRDATKVPPQAAAALEDADASGSRTGSKKLDQIIDDLRQRQGELSKEGRGILEEEKRGIRSGVGAIDAARQRIENTPIPQMQRAPRPPQFDAQAGMQWASAAALLGAMAGGFVRRGSTAALTAFAAANKGYAQGNQQAFENATAEWKMQSQQVKEDNQDRIDQYKMIISREGKNVDLMLGEIKLAAKAWDDSMMANAADRKDAQLVASLLEKQIEHQEGYKFKQEAQDLATRKFQAQLNGAALGGRGGVVGMMLNKWIQEQNDAGTPPTEEQIQKKYKQVITEQSGGRAAGTYGTRVDINVRNAATSIDAAIKSSANVPRSNFVPLNRLIQEGKVMTSDPALKTFAVNNLQIAEAWAKAMNVTGVMRESDRDLALSMINTTQGPAAYAASLNALRGILLREQKMIQEEKEGAPMPDIPVAPETPQGQVGGSNVDPYEGITVKVK
jgi:hypothetical protein